MNTGKSESTERWARFSKTTELKDLRWRDGLIDTILSDLSSKALGGGVGRAGDPFELLCEPLIRAQPGVAKVERVKVEYDWGTDLIGKDEDGYPTWYVQCKFWSPTGKKRRTSLNDVAAWESKVRIQVTSDWAGRSNITARAVWVTTAPVDDGARQHIARANSLSSIRFEIWSPDELCSRLLTTHGIGFVRTEPSDGAEYVVVDREALRGFRHAAEAALEGGPTGERQLREDHAEEESERPRFLSQTERRQALEEVLGAAGGEPLPFEELLAKAGEWLGLSEGEQRFTEPGKPMPLFEFLMGQALDDLREDGVAELHSGRRWSLSAYIGSAAEASPAESATGGDPGSNGGVARPRFLSPAERQQALEAALREAEGSLPFKELLAKAGEWLGLPKGEQIYTEPGEPVSLFEHLMTRALDDLREEGVAELHSGRRWSLSVQGEPAVEVREAQEPSGDAEVVRPRFLSQAERRQALEEVLGAAGGEPLPFEELLAKAGEWLGLSEGEQRFTQPGKPMPVFEFLMGQALDDLRKEGVAELHSGRRWGHTR